MKKLRTVHLFLGCIFAPMLLFFAISGIWQMFGMDYTDSHPVLSRLTTIHTARGLKGGPPTNLSSPMLKAYVLAMAFGLIVTTIIGVIMAFRFGQSRRTTFYCLVFGCLFPLVLVCLKAFL
jgi:hypothetical protein